MQNFDDAHYNNQRMIHSGLGIPYDVDFHRLEDAIYCRLYNERYVTANKLAEIKENSKYIFLTINRNAQIGLLDFINKINKMMSKKWITDYLYVYEQRGENEAETGKGFHFHLILKKPKTKKYSEMIRELSNSANSVCDTSNFHFFNLKSISEEE